MAAPDPAIVERQFYLQQLGWAVDDTSYSLAELKERYELTKTIRGLDVNIRREPGMPLSTSIATVASGGVIATDTGDGGFSLTTSPVSKVSKWSYVESTFLKLVNAAALAVTTPLKNITGGFAGTAITAARGDHQHPITNFFGGGIYGSTAVFAGGGLVPYHQPTGNNSGVSTLVNQKGPINALPIYYRQTIKEFNMKMGTAGDASATIAWAIYGTNSYGCITGAPIYTSSHIAATTGGIKTWSGLSITLDPGLYMIVLCAKGFTTTRPLPFPVAGSLPNLWLPSGANGSATSDTTVGLGLTTVNETTGAFPSSVATTDLTFTNNGNSAFWYGYTADQA